VNDPLKPDLCVIGAGAAGLSMTAIARAFGASVVLIEKGMMGGECLNRGCVPSKALLATGAAAQTFRDAGPFGIATAQPRVDFAKVMRHVQGVVDAIAPNDSVARYTAMGATVIQAPARFVDGRIVVAGETTIRARRVVLATGSRPRIPGIPGLSDVPHFTTDTIFGLAKRPTRLVILGGGAAGIELAQAFRRLGSEVLVVEPERALSREDPELAAVVLTRLRREGVEIREGVSVERVEPWRDGARVHLPAAGGETEAIEASHLLVVTGREPAVDGLDLDAAGITHDPRGILVDAGLTTTNKRVYAIGDCAGGPFAGLKQTHVANYHAGVVARRVLFKLSAKVDYAGVPSVVYTDPEIASVGLREEGARDAHRKIRVLRWPFSENDRAQAEHATEGHVKVITDDAGKVLGASIVGRGAGDLIVPWTMAVREGLDVASFRDLVMPYPTLSEASKRAAVSFYQGAAEGGLVRTLLKALRIFG
jgi:pyruvate/2-oxoglutarate dehydrogenase complex dihydrolipoamide dehydrogenase (E3) component